MIGSGAWKDMDISNYITCDDYDGKNGPKRKGLDFKDFISKVIYS